MTPLSRKWKMWERLTPKTNKRHKENTLNYFHNIQMKNMMKNWKLKSFCSLKTTKMFIRINASASDWRENKLWTTMLNINFSPLLVYFWIIFFFFSSLWYIVTHIIRLWDNFPDIYIFIFLIIIASYYQMLMNCQKFFKKRA